MSDTPDPNDSDSARANGLGLLNLSCRQATRLISHARDRKLSRLERLGLSIHLALCRPCRRFRRQLAYLGDLLRAEREDNPSLAPTSSAMPDDLRTRLRQRIEQSS